VSEPTPAPLLWRRQAARYHCGICGEATREPIAFGMGRPSLATGLAAAHPNVMANNVICRKQHGRHRGDDLDALFDRGPAGRVRETRRPQAGRRTASSSMGVHPSLESSAGSADSAPSGAMSLERVTLIGRRRALSGSGASIWSSSERNMQTGSAQ
jgi:hypothetical protein